MHHRHPMLTIRSPEDPARAQGQDLVAVKEELRPRKGRSLPRLSDSPADPEPHGARRGMRCVHVLPMMATDHDQQNEVASHLEDGLELQEGSFPNDEKTQKYGNLLFLLQSEPRHIAHLCRLVSMAEIDALLQTVMFTIYGNQYESREEHLLLTMFQVRECLQFRQSQLTHVSLCSPSSSTTRPTTARFCAPTLQYPA